MKNGDVVAKKFGGVTGTDPDWFKLTITGSLNGNPSAQSVDLYLADFRSPDTTQHYIVKDWQWVDLSSLGNVNEVQFTLSSSDTGSFGMNTPAYFAIDNFTSNSQVPVTQNDYVTVNYLQDTLISVLANDYDPYSHPLSIQLVSGPSVPGASAVVDSVSQNILYTPAIGVQTTDYFVYEACNDEILCDTAIVFITIDGITGIREISTQQISVAPNPFTSSFVVQHSTNTNNVVVYDMQGREVRNVICKNNTNTTEITGNDLAPGVYIVRLVSGTTSQISKVVKQ
jgi:hypothetical protein